MGFEGTQSDLCSLAEEWEDPFSLGYRGDGTKGGVISRWSSQVLHPGESCPALVPRCVYPTTGPQTAWQVVKKKEESHDGPGKGCQAVLPHPVASQLCAGMGSPRVGEPGLLQRRNLSREQRIFSI